MTRAEGELVQDLSARLASMASRRTDCRAMVGSFFFVMIRVFQWFAPLNKAYLVSTLRQSELKKNGVAKENDAEMWSAQFIPTQAPCLLSFVYLGYRLRPLCNLYNFSDASIVYFRPYGSFYSYLGIFKHSTFLSPRLPGTIESFRSLMLWSHLVSIIT